GVGVVDFNARRLTIVDSTGAATGTVGFQAAPMLVRTTSTERVALTILELDVWIPAQEERRRQVRVEWVSPDGTAIATQALALPGRPTACGRVGRRLLELDGWMPAEEDRRRQVRVEGVARDGTAIATQALALPDTVPVTRAPLLAGAWSPEHGFGSARAWVAI